jgi:hypothetical protein
MLRALREDNPYKLSAIARQFLVGRIPDQESLIAQSALGNRSEILQLEKFTGALPFPRLATNQLTFIHGCKLWIGD